MQDKILKYYSRKDVQKKIVEASKDREVGVKYGEKGFGKRPDIIQFDNDVFELAKEGATSFHLSEERWNNPLLLQPGLSKGKLDDLRSGWDLCLPSFENILISDNKEIKIVTFKELSDLLNINTIGRFKINRKINVYSLEPSSMKIRQDRVKEFIVRKCRTAEELVKITVKDGKTINISLDHPVLIFTSEGIKIKNAQNISQGDYLLTPLKLDLERKTNEINLIDLIIKHKVKKEYKIKYKNTNISKFIIYTEKLDKYIPRAIRNFISKRGFPFNFNLDLDEDLDYKKEAYIGFRRSKIKLAINYRL